MTRTDSIFEGVDPIDQIFELMELPTLREDLDSGRFPGDVSDEELLNYCRTAAFAWYGGPHRGVSDTLAMHLADNIVQVFTGGGPRYREIDSEPFLLDLETGKPCPILPNTFKHWERMVRILKDQELADRVLDEAPGPVKEHALAGVRETTDQRFNDIIDGFESGT